MNIEGILGIGVVYVSLLSSALIVLIVCLFRHLNKKSKYKTMVEISKNLPENKDSIEKLLEALNANDTQVVNKKDSRRTGVITLGTGIGLFLFGLYIDESYLEGIGLLVTVIGISLFIGGYFFSDKRQADTDKQKEG